MTKGDGDETRNLIEHLELARERAISEGRFVDEAIMRASIALLEASDPPPPSAAGNGAARNPDHTVAPHRHRYSDDGACQVPGCQAKRRARAAVQTEIPGAAGGGAR